MKTIKLPLGQRVRRSLGAAALMLSGLALHAQPLLPGQAVGTCFSGFNGTVVNTNGHVMGIEDVRSHNLAPLGDNWSPTVFMHPSWVASEMGQIFGIAVDGDANIYVTATTVYGRYTSGTNGAAGAGGVYKIDATTWNATPFLTTVSSGNANTVGTTTLPNFSPTVSVQSGLGNICYDPDHDLLFVTNHEDGRIYRIDVATGVVLSRFDPFNNDNQVGGFCPLGERIWGIGYLNGRIYFSRWVEDKMQVDPVGSNEIWSVALNASGDFSGTEQLEITLPNYGTTSWSSPVSDIEFNAAGDMLLGERTMHGDSPTGLPGSQGTYAHRSRVLEYAMSGTTWNFVRQIYVGNISGNTNCSGGVDYGYAAFDPSEPDVVMECDSMIWCSGDGLTFPNHNNCPGLTPTASYTYGFQGTNATNGNTDVVGPNYVECTSVYIDADANTGSGDKVQIGDIDIYVRPEDCAGETICENAMFPDDVTVISSNYTVTGNEFWDDKYYISDNVTVTIPSGAVLDVTNVDLLFGRCAGIDVEGDGRIRANNSVFRPCIESDVWRGIHFRSESSYNKINECTFKNAVNALHFEKNSDGVVSNNLFYNNNRAIRTSDVNQFDFDISGNRVVLDEKAPDFEMCEGGQNGVLYGLQAIRTNFNGHIAHNEFVNNIDDGSLVYGVYFNGSSGVISENTLNNQWRSILVINSYGLKQPVSIENNEIEVNLTQRNYEHQISLLSMRAPCRVYQNEIHNTVQDVNSGLSHSAIHCNGVFMADIRENVISGFNVGVEMDYTYFSQVSQNQITNAQIYGIYGNWTLGLEISCNEIDLDFGKAIGIKMIDDHDATAFGYAQTRIHSNCIKDCQVSMDLSYPSGILTPNIPEIANNYMYNYVSYGIYSTDYTGSIGSPSNPGMNTFYSNKNTAVDISSNNNLMVADNFGVFNITFPFVQITSNNPYHSTASCGHQIYNMPSQGNLDEKLVCSDFERVIKPVSQIFGFNKYATDREKVEEAKAEASLVKEGVHVRWAPAAIQALSFDDKSGAELYLEKLARQEGVSQVDLDLAAYHLALSQTDFERASDLLNGIQNSRAEISNQVFLEKLQLEVTTGAKNVSELDAGDRLMLQDIANDGTENCNIARALLKELDDQIEFRLKDVVLSSHTQFGEVVETDNMFLEVFPNPASGEFIKVRHSRSSTETVQVRVVDLTGRPHLSQTLNTSTAIAQIDIRGLAPGMYMVVIEEADGSMLKATFVRQ